MLSLYLWFVHSFQLRSVTNSAEMNSYTSFGAHIYVFLLGKYIGMKLLGLRGELSQDAEHAGTLILDFQPPEL